MSGKWKLIGWFLGMITAIVVILGAEQFGQAGIDITFGILAGIGFSLLGFFIGDQVDEAQRS